MMWRIPLLATGLCLALAEVVYPLGTEGTHPGGTHPLVQPEKLVEKAAADGEQAVQLSEAEKAELLMKESKHDHDSDVVPDIHDFVEYLSDSGHEDAQLGDPDTLRMYMQHARFVEHRASVRKVRRFLGSLPGMCMIAGVLALLVILLVRCCLPKSYRCMPCGACIPGGEGMFKAGEPRKVAKAD